MREGRRPAPTRENEAGLEERQVEARAVERHDTAGALDERGERGEERALFVEVADVCDEFQRYRDLYDTSGGLEQRRNRKP